MFSTSSRRDLVFSAIVGIVVAVPVYYFDLKLYPRDEIGKHLADHILAIVAIIGAALAIRYERKLDQAFERQKAELNKSFDEQKDRIEKIVLAIYTQYLGEWPSHLKEITGLVARATTGDEILISVDSFGYGHFSYPDEYKRYFSALESAIRSQVKIQFLLHSEQAARECLRLQIKKQYGDSFDTLKPKLPDYQKAYPQLIKSLPSSFEEVMSLVLCVQNSLCRQLKDAVTGAPVDVHLTINPSIPDAVFFWMIRRQGKPIEMVFAYPKYAGVGTGYGFQTHDVQLMDIFSRQFDAKWKETTELDRGDDLYPEAVARFEAGGKADHGRPG